MIPLIVVAVILLILLFTNIFIVPQQKTYVLERLGKYKTTFTAGLHVKIPFIDRISNKISLKEQVLDFPPQPIITKDNVTITVDSVVYMKVFDSQLFTYGIEDPISGLQNLTATTLRAVIGDMELDQTLSSREEINAKMLSQLDIATDPWGIKITRVEVKNIQPPAEIEEVMTKQMRAERERRQAVTEAEAHQQSVVTRAEGDKKAKILAAEAERDAQIALAEGKAKSIELTYTAQAEGLKKLNEANISNEVLQLKGIEVLKDVADGQATKIYMPTNIADSLTSYGLFGDSIKDGKSIDKSTVTRDELREKAKRELMQPDPCVKPEASRVSKGAAFTTEYNNADAAVDANN